MDGSSIKFAEVFWKLDVYQIEYRCLSCGKHFQSNFDCYWHIENCLQDLLDSAEDSKEHLELPTFVEDSHAASNEAVQLAGVAAASVPEDDRIKEGICINLF